MSNQDERRAYLILQENYYNTIIPNFEEKWKQFLKEKSHYGKPLEIVAEFLENTNTS